MCRNGRSLCPSIAGQRCTRSKGKGPILIKSKCYRHLVELDVPRSINGFPSVCACTWTGTAIWWVGLALIAPWMALTLSLINITQRARDAKLGLGWIRLVLYRAPFSHISGEPGVLPPTLALDQRLETSVPLWPPHLDHPLTFLAQLFSERLCP